MKKIIALIMALSLMSTLAVFAGAVSYYGDVDGDGNINSSDALSILRYAVGIEKEIDEKTADITKDGEINSSDALAVLQTAVGMKEAQIIEEEDFKGLISNDAAVIADFYNKAVKATGNNVPEGQKTMKLDGDITGDGAFGAVFKVASPIIEHALQKKSTSTDVIPGYETDLLASDIKSATAVSNNGVTTLTIQLKEQKDGPDADPNTAGPVSRGIGTLGNINGAIEELGAELYSGRETISLKYSDAYIICTIDENTGKITSGTWHYKANLTVENAEIKLGLKFTAKNLKACVDYTVVIDKPIINEESEKNPLDYSKKEIVEFCNKAVEGSYKENVSVTSSELVSITLNSITGGETVKNLANSIVSKYTEPTTLTKAFSDGKAEDGTALKYFTACGGIDADGVKTASIKKNGSGYEVELTIVEEKADLANPPKYNSQASRPLDINSIDLMGAKVSKADYTYTGTVLKTVIDENGKITSTSVRMPLVVIGEGKLTVFKISVDASGVYTNESTFKY